ncbi:MAG: Sec-independent protein translocase subunit TatA/TatB [Acidobacteriaceae bacterium]
MSLPDTVFIFVLALIIFGPKKLPEIGRQLGKLVGEFRRASNEFKFQIEEELRLAELSDRPTIAPHKKELESSSTTASSEESSSEAEASTSPEVNYEEEMLPAGQHPNLDNLDPYELETLHQKLAEPENAEYELTDGAPAETEPGLTSYAAVVGTEPRSVPPHAGAEFDEMAAGEEIAPEFGGPTESNLPAVDANGPVNVNVTEMSGQESADLDATHAVADMTHG